MGKRPQTRGVAMNPVDHPHGGGEGQTTRRPAIRSPRGASRRSATARARRASSPTAASSAAAAAGRRAELMSRSSKKGPFVEERLMARIEAMNASGKNR